MLGLLNRIVDATGGADFMKQVMDYARQFTTPNKASRAVGRIKRAIDSLGPLNELHDQRREIPRCDAAPKRLRKSQALLGRQRQQL